MEKNNIDPHELDYLQRTEKAILKKIDMTEKRLADTRHSFENEKKFLGENYYYVDKEGDLAQKFSEIAMLEENAQNLELEHKRLSLQLRSPYFARIDFTPKGKKTTQKIYIGLNNVFDGATTLVVDWRAPISSMYYDYPLGKASFATGKNTIEGEMSLKRQYKIENRQLLSYFDTDLTINDDILQEILSKHSSAKMRQIVSSIQKEQNAIVRTEKYDNVLVQGVAGSGKTSIVLHRAAYLLYKHRKTLKSSDIIILSPNNIFSSYISEVLPQLGENNLAETTYDRICHVELHKPIQTREDMLDEIATSPTQKQLDEISFKSSFEYLDELLKFMQGPLVETFSPKTLSYCIGFTPDDEKIEITFPEEQTKDLFFNAYKDMDIYERIAKIAWQYAMVFTERRHYNKAQFKGLRDRFKRILYNFLPIKDSDKLTQIFLARMGLTVPKNGGIKYMDKGVMLALNHFIYGFEHDFSAKYLIIDEMQDFTPVDLYVFKKLWNCQSIIVGDINQCIEKTLTKEYLDEVAQFLNTKLITLTKTYRSTKEIARFAHAMIGLDGIDYVNRSGQEPELIKSQDMAKDIAKIVEENDDYDHIAIICKSHKERSELAKMLKGVVDFHTIDNSEDYNHKVLLTTCATVKGIEFDCVIVPNADQDNYVNNVDKNILYVSSTRALHKLYFLYNTQPSKFLKGLKK